MGGPAFPFICDKRCFPNLEAPVNLLAQHHPGQLMGKGHGGHGKPLPGPLHRWRQPKGAADDKAHRPRGLHGPRQPLCHSGGIHRLPLNAQGVHRSRRVAKDLLPLFFQGGGDLRLGWAAGQPCLRQLDELPLAQRAQTLFILRHSVPPIGFLQFSHADQLDCQHAAPS